MLFSDDKQLVGLRFREKLNTTVNDIKAFPNNKPNWLLLDFIMLPTCC